MNKKMEKEAAFWELHKEIVDKIMAFCKEYEVNAEECRLIVDGMKPSIEEGKWISASDSAITLYDDEQNVLLSSM